MTNVVTDHWNAQSDQYFKNSVEYYEAIVKNPEKAFPTELYPLLLKYMGDLRGKKVLVPSSGDHVGAFGFALLGAAVTSCDIAENQLKNAQKIADQYHIQNIEFICQDSMKLDQIEDGKYDLVYTSNGVHVWINDLTSMYQNFHRALKNGGYYIFFETHPMNRPFDQTTYEIKIKKPYEDVGPFIDRDGEITYGWRTQDLVNAILTAGFRLKEMQEFHSLPADLKSHNYLYIQDPYKGKFKWYGDTFDWRNNPWAALPQCLCLCSQKE